MNRFFKTAVSAALAGAVLLAAGGCAKSPAASSSSAPASSQTDKNLTIHYGYQPGQAQIVAADQMGYLKDEFSKDGITVELDKFASGPSLISALTAGSVDFGQVGSLPAIAAKANNVDLHIVGSYIKSEKITGLIATPKSGISKIADIKGKKIGVTVGSSGQEFLYIYLNSVKLKPTDIQIVNLQPGDIVSSLTSGNIDGAVTWEPYLTMTTSKGVTQLVADGEGYKKEEDVIIATQKFLQAHTDASVRILKVLDKAAKWLQSNPDDGVSLAAKNAGVDAAALAPTLSKADLSIGLSSEDITSISQTEKFLRENDIIRKDVDVKQLVDTSYLKKAGVK